MTFSFAAPGTVILGLNNQSVFNTQDDSSWLSWKQGLPYRTITNLNSSPNRVYAGTAKGLFFYGGQEQSLATLLQGLKNSHVYSLALADPQGKILYLGTGPFEGRLGCFSSVPPSVYKSTEHAQTWTPCEKGLDEGTLIYDMAVQPRSPQELFWGTSNGVYRSTDAGASWLAPGGRGPSRQLQDPEHPTHPRQNQRPGVPLRSQPARHLYDHQLQGHPLGRRRLRPSTNHH